MDILSDILRSMQVHGSVYFCEQVQPPWRKVFANKATAGFHLVRSGACWVEVAGCVEQLNDGDLIFLGPGVDHVLTSEPNNPNQPAFLTPTLLLCGYCSFEADVLTPLQAIFPNQTIVRAAEVGKHPWLKSTFEQLSSEYMAQSLGNEIIVNKLTEVILVELIRINFGRNQEHSFLAALQDKRIKQALECLHQDYQLPWTIELLANAVGMSRAALAKHFKALVGEPVFSYLSTLRVQRAKERLLRSTQRVDDIALAVGYESERAFAKTFAKLVGMTPRQYRKNQGIHN